MKTVKVGHTVSHRNAQYYKVYNKYNKMKNKSFLLDNASLRCEKIDIKMYCKIY